MWTALLRGAVHEFAIALRHVAPTVEITHFVHVRVEEDFMKVYELRRFWS
jgi:hypothetical protein